MASDQYKIDIDQAARTANYALDLAVSSLRKEFGDKHVSVANCIEFAAVIVTKLGMMHEYDMRNLEIENSKRLAR